MPTRSMQKHVKKWFEAAKADDAETIGRFLAENFDIETRDDNKRSALHVAAEHNAINVASVLLKNNANLEAKMCDEGTPLLDAVASGHLEMVLLLLGAGANYQIRDECEWTSMHWIAKSDRLHLLNELNIKFPELVKSLVSAKRWNGVTPLHLASSEAMIKALIALGAPVDAEILEHGETLLIEATEQNDLMLVRCLVEQGANILHVNADKQTARDIAEIKGYIGLKTFFDEILLKQHTKVRKHTGYHENRTAALTAGKDKLDEYRIEYHASRRIDLFFFTLIAYYKSKLVIALETTNRQHGKGSADTRACHSAILTSLWDTTKTRTSHEYNTRSLNKTTSYRTGILNNTHFADSLNMTVELDKAVNYFDSYYIEGHIDYNKMMRAAALDILNEVSQGKTDPIKGMNKFLNKLHDHFVVQKDSYYAKEELKTSPKTTRAAIYSSQYMGSFFNSCGFKSSNEAPTVIKLKKDYIQAQLPLSKDERIQLREKPDFFSKKDKKAIYDKAFLQVKRDMDLPVQYQKYQLG